MHGTLFSKKQHINIVNAVMLQSFLFVVLGKCEVNFTKKPIFSNDIKLSIFDCVANFYQNIILYKIIYCSLKSTVSNIELFKS